MPSTASSSRLPCAAGSWATLAISILLSACSGSSGSNNAQSDGGAGGASSGGGGGGSNGSGGEPDGGSPGSNGGGGQADGGSAGSGSSGGSGSSDGGTTSSDCDGMLPTTLAAPAQVVLSDGHSACGPGTTDPSGRVTLAIFENNSTLTAWGMHPYTADGDSQGFVMEPLLSSGRDLLSWFHWTSSGFHGVSGPGSGHAHLRAWDSQGNFISDSADSDGNIVSITPDGQGGSVALAQDAGSSNFFIEWFDAATTLTHEAPVDQDPSQLTVNWGTGHVFLLLNGLVARPRQGRWFDGHGNPLTPWFVLGTSVGTYTSKHLLLDGSVVLNDGSKWAVAASDGADHSSPPPDWLAARPNTRIASIRGGRGYAVIPVDAGDKLEVVTASGQSCGTVTMPSDSSPDGTQRSLDVGEDGTVFQVLAGPFDTSASQRCEFRWWPALLH